MRNLRNTLLISLAIAALLVVSALFVFNDNVFGQGDEDDETIAAEDSEDNEAAAVMGENGNEAVSVAGNDPDIPFSGGELNNPANASIDSQQYGSTSKKGSTNTPVNKNAASSGNLSQFNKDYSGMTDYSNQPSGKKMASASTANSGKDFRGNMSNPPKSSAGSTDTIKEPAVNIGTNTAEKEQADVDQEYRKKASGSDESSLVENNPNEMQFDDEVAHTDSLDVDSKSSSQTSIAEDIQDSDVSNDSVIGSQTDPAESNGSNEDDGEDIQQDGIDHSDESDFTDEQMEEGEQLIEESVEYEQSEEQLDEYEQADEEGKLDNEDELDYDGNNQDEDDSNSDNDYLDSKQIMILLANSLISDSGTYTPWLDTDGWEYQSIASSGIQRTNCFSIYTSTENDEWSESTQYVTFCVEELNAFNLLQFTMCGENGNSGEMDVYIYIDCEMEGNPDYYHHFDSCAEPETMQIAINGASFINIVVSNSSGNDNNMVFYDLEVM